MRYVLTLTIGLLAALGAPATTASAHDYHRSHRAVEAQHFQAHHKAKRRFHRRAHKRAHQRHRARRHHARRHVDRRQSWDDHRSRFVIVISDDGGFRIARRYN